MEEIDRLRKEIDKIDSRIMNLVLERKRASSRVIAMKKHAGMPVYDSAREGGIIKSLLEEFGGALDERLISALMQAILDDSKAREGAPGKKKCALFSSAGTADAALELKARPFIIAGPCAAESLAQVESLAEKLAAMGIRFMRGGAFKPRTSPDSFQGLGAGGIKMLREAAAKRGMFLVTEVLDIVQLEENYDKIDMIQIGSRSMTSFELLKKIGKMTAADRKPVLLKRGWSSTLNELISASEYITRYGNTNVMLCLRGIRTFEQIDSDLRNTPDLAGILELKSMTGLPVVFDPSHATGNSKYVIDVAKAALLLGADGLMIEVHDHPEAAKSDGAQAILPEALREIAEFIRFRL